MNPLCPRCGRSRSIRHGVFYRADDAQSIQRYRCRDCGKCHSSATHAPTWRQKRRRINCLIELDLASGVSQRRCAMRVGCDRKTVARKLDFLAEQARGKLAHWLAEHGPFEAAQGDELVTFEHSRLKPLAAMILVSAPHRCIIGFGVAQIPASGQIATKSREKYGKRPDQSAAMRRQVLTDSAAYLSTETLLIETDEKKPYVREIATRLPHAEHRRYRSVRGALTGQGELKRTGYDPLFAINHTLAMLRDNIKCLARRTWCTIKRADRLEALLAIYAHFHNTRLLKRLPAPAASGGEGG